MQLTARLIQVLPVETGMGKNGEWKKQSIVLETDGQYPKKVCITIWGDKISESQLQIGNILAVDFDIESREYNGRWYTDVKAWKVEVAGQGAPEMAIGGAPANVGFPPPPPPLPENEKDDLPF